MANFKDSCGASVFLPSSLAKLTWKDWLSRSLWSIILGAIGFIFFNFLGLGVGIAGGWFFGDPITKALIAGAGRLTAADCKLPDNQKWLEQARKWWQVTNIQDNGLKLASAQEINPFINLLTQKPTILPTTRKVLIYPSNDGINWCYIFTGDHPLEGIFDPRAAKAIMDRITTKMPKQDSYVLSREETSKLQETLENADAAYSAHLKKAKADNIDYPVYTEPSSVVTSFSH